jgi:hypothetical protein
MASRPRANPTVIPFLFAGFALALGGIALGALFQRRRAAAGDGRRRERSLKLTGRPSRGPDELRTAILGNTKTAVASIFGPPRVATFSGSTASGNYLEADTWYYAMPAGDRIGMVIQFDDDRAENVEFFHAPH